MAIEYRGVKGLEKGELQKVNQEMNMNETIGIHKKRSIQR